MHWFRWAILSTGYLLVGFAAWADFNVQISLQQKSSALVLSTTLHNSEDKNLQFQLSGGIKNISASSSLKDSVQGDGSHIFTLAANQDAKLNYSLPEDFTQNLFLSDDDMWVPAVTDSQVQQFYQLSSQLLPSFILIDSTTGHAQYGLAVALGKFTKYSSQDKRLNVFLAQPDSDLANTLLTSLNGYLSAFEQRYGAYPYDQFSVVESDQEIGFAFPRMTWIGSELLRFPFILTSSLPHELLHSWWGNGVFVDYATGNWCEGFTVFGADYGVLSDADKKVYRLKAIANYLDYVKQSTEIPLSKFSSRGEDPSLQAIGYDKAMMVLVMLEQIVGEKVFLQAQRDFYSTFKYKTASYMDFFAILGALSGQDLSSFYSFWIEQKGLLAQSFISAHLGQTPNSVQWSGVNSELAKIANFPIAGQVQLAAGPTQAQILQVNSAGSVLAPASTVYDSLPTAFGIDQDFYLFRNLSDQERPVEFAEVFGANEIELSQAATSLRSDLQQAFPDKTLSPVAGPIDFSLGTPILMSFVEGQSNSTVAGYLKNKKIQIAGNVLSLEGQQFDLSNQSVFLSFRIEAPAPSTASSLVVLYQMSSSLPNLRWLQRWSHYGANSYLVMTTQGAAIQGLWLQPFWQNFAKQ